MHEGTLDPQDNLDIADVQALRHTDPTHGKAIIFTLFSELGAQYFPYVFGAGDAHTITFTVLSELEPTPICLL